MMRVHDNGIKSVLPQVPRPFVTNIGSFCVFVMELAEECRQAVGLPWNDYRMDVIWHQTVRENIQ
jgi:hypothetical protein